MSSRASGSMLQEERSDYTKFTPQQSAILIEQQLQVKKAKYKTKSVSHISVLLH